MIVWSEAEDRESIFVKAETGLEIIASNNNEDPNGFDYHTILGSKDDKYETSGSHRWGKKPNPVKLESKIGKKLVDDGIEFVRKEAVRNLTGLSKLLKTHTP